ncbi:hypothetical protein BGZ65_000219, partial [Modicella reniformis]
MVRPFKLDAVNKRPRKAWGRPSNDDVSAQASEAYRKRKGPYRPGEITYYLANSRASVASASGSGLGAYDSETSGSSSNILSDTDSESPPGSEESVRDDSDGLNSETEAFLIEAGAYPAPLLVT